MEEDKIYYNAGFKSYDITRRCSKAEKWFDWVEHSRNLIRQVTISINVIKWIVYVFNMASKEQKKTVKRWNKKDHFAVFFCIPKYNEHGRYISFIAIQGESKSIIITSETTYKEGWGHIVLRYPLSLMFQKKKRCYLSSATFKWSLLSWKPLETTDGRQKGQMFRRSEGAALEYLLWHNSLRQRSIG